MPKEREGYRDNLERLDAAFPGRELLRKSEVAGWLGISKTTLRERFDLPPGQYVSKATVARELART